MRLKFLIDEPLSRRLIDQLSALGHDAVHVAQRGALKAPDADIVRLAQQERRIILTADLDYGHLLITSPTTPPSAIIFRLKTQTITLMNELLALHLPRVAPALAEGAIVIIEEDDVRIRRLPPAIS